MRKTGKRNLTGKTAGCILAAFLCMTAISGISVYADTVPATVPATTPVTPVPAQTPAVPVTTPATPVPAQTPAVPVTTPAVPAAVPAAAPAVPAAIPGSVLSVGPGQRYATITEAVLAAKNGDSILVYPGIYLETVDCRTKELSIIGTDRNNCILCYSDDFYNFPPLQMAAGKLENLTVRVMKHIMPEDVTPKAYCMHVDDDHLIGKSLQVRNVTFFSDSYQTVGIGLRPSSMVVFDSCSFYSMGSYAALFCHDWETKKGTILQNLIVMNCEFYNEGPAPTILMHSQEIAGAQATALFVNNKITNRADKKALFGMQMSLPPVSGSGFLGTSDWVLDERSIGNSASELNYPAPAAAKALPLPSALPAETAVTAVPAAGAETSAAAPAAPAAVPAASAAAAEVPAATAPAAVTAVPAVPAATPEATAAPASTTPVPTIPVTALPAEAEGVAVN